MQNAKLRGVFEDLGFANVMSVISSGNVLFESERTDIAGLEADIEARLLTQLGFHSTTIIRSRAQLEALVRKQPFGDAVHSPKQYLTVTFLKTPQTVQDLAPKLADRMVATYPDTVCCVVDTTTSRTPDLMAWLEKAYSKQITTRTWLTVQRILKRWGSPG